MLAPICLFTYNRLNETIKTVEALQKNYLANKSDLFIFSDGPKSYEKSQEVEEVRKYIRTIKGFNTITISESLVNKGLANSIISGVTQIIEKYGKVIVLEDDLVTSSNFLDFLNQGLNFYTNYQKIFSISGYCYDLPSLKNYSKDYLLGYRASSLGWGTWLDRWTPIDWQVKEYNKFKWNFIRQFHFMRGGSDMPKMLKKQMKGQIDSWAIRWCFHQFQNDMLTVFSSKSKINHIGLGAQATHTKKTNRYDTELDNGFQTTFTFHENLELNTILIRELRQKYSIISRLHDKFDF